MWIFNCPSTIYWKDLPFLTVLQWHISYKSCDPICIDLFVDFKILFHWSICLSSCQYDIVLITIALSHIFYVSSVSPLTLFLITVTLVFLAFSSPFIFHISMARINLSNFHKHIIIFLLCCNFILESLRPSMCFICRRCSIYVLWINKWNHILFNGEIITTTIFSLEGKVYWITISSLYVLNNIKGGFSVFIRTQFLRLY